MYRGKNITELRDLIDNQGVSPEEIFKRTFDTPWRTCNRDVFR